MPEDDPLKILKEGKQADMFADYDGPMTVIPETQLHERILKLEQQVRDLLAINATRT